MSPVIAILLAILLPSIGGIFRWYQQKKVIMDAERAAREREQAMLRTGRDPLEEAARRASRTQQTQPPQRPREGDLQAERQEALRQLRRQQADQAEAAIPRPGQHNAPSTPRGGGSSGGPITRELWPGGPVVVINGPAAAPAPRAPSPSASRPQQELRRPQQRQQPQRPQKAKPVQKRPQQQQQQHQQPHRPTQAQKQAAREEARIADAAFERERALVRSRALATPAPAAATPVFVPPTTAQQWRTAFIAAEILGTPVSMRDPSVPIGCPIR